MTFAVGSEKIFKIISLNKPNYFKPILNPGIMHINIQFQCFMHPYKPKIL